MLQLFDTLTRSKRPFVPQQPKLVTMYSCGPTVYTYAHIGNMRAYIFMDILRRVLKFDGYKLKGVLNVTDVGHLQSDADDGEDKMQTAAKRENTSPHQIAARITEAFFADLKRLNIARPEIVAKATDHIDDMLRYCIALVEKGHAYETSDGIYFDISTFPSYGKLSGISLDDQLAGARVEVNPEKRNPADFALWKKAEPSHIMQWDSPWGRSYPGWHIECSAMSRKYLGKTMDIHTGGIDHIPIHHENEIAQSECYDGCKTVNYWLHSEFLQFDGGKMSKSLGNTYTITDLIGKGYRALDYRYFCLNAHYRKKLNFTFAGLDAASTAYSRLLSILGTHRVSPASTPTEELDRYRAEFRTAINDDLNLPLALGQLWTIVKRPPSKDIFSLALEFDEVFGLDLKLAEPPPEQPDQPIPDHIRALADQRALARQNKDFATSDLLRNQLSTEGYLIEDTPTGYKLKKK